MQMLFTNKPNAIVRWFSARLNSRLDRLWLGSALCVAVLVASVLDFRYVPTFLIGYWYVFTMFLRKQVKAQYPPRHHPRADIYSEGDSFWCKTGKLRRSKKFREERRKSVWRIAIWLFCAKAFAWIADDNDWPAEVFSTIFNNIVFGCLFIYLCPSSSHDEYSGWRKSRLNMDAEKTANLIRKYFEFALSTGRTITAIVLWCGMVFLYAKGFIGGENFFGNKHPELVIFFPVVFNAFLFIFLSIDVHWRSEKCR